MVDEREGEDANVRRYGRIPERPQIVGDGEFARQAERIAEWVRTPHKGLKVGGIWGDRGSGKTSMLYTVLGRLDRDAASELRLPKLRTDEVSTGSADPINPRRLFDLAKVDDGQRILMHLVRFLDQLCWYGLETSIEPHIEKIFEIEARMAMPDQFLEYAQGTATSAPRMMESAVEHYRKTSAWKHDMEAAIAGVFGEICKDGERVVLPIDDIDLEPHWAYELLRTLHVFFSRTPLVVLLGADRDLLTRSVAFELKKRGFRDSSLAAKSVAKYVSAEWRLPLPSAEERERVVLQGPDELSEGSVFRGGMLWEGFRSPHKPATSPIDERDDDTAVEVVSRRASVGVRSEPVDDPDVPRLPGKADAQALFRDALPTTWRGVNRLYNRLVALAEMYATPPDDPRPGLVEKYRSVVGSADHNVPSFLALVEALEESFPMLGILDAFDQEPSRLRAGLESGPDRWGVSRDDLARLYPVRDRLLDDAFISGRERGRAEPLLQRLGWLWRELWEASLLDDPDACLVTLSVYGDAMKRSESWWSERILEPARRHDIELPKVEGRPSALLIQRMWAILGLKLSTLPKYLENDMRVFGRAPLSLMVLFGWGTRQRFRQVEVLQEYLGSFRLFGDAVEPGFASATLDVVESQTHQSVEGENGREAMVVLEIRTNPDRSTGFRFRNESGEDVSAFRSVKIVSPDGYVLRTNEQVGDVLAELQTLLRNLRENDEIRHIHLGLACPSAIGFLVGRHLHPWAPVSIYEYAPHGEGGPTYDYVDTIG